MALFLICVFAAVCAALIFWGLTRRTRIYQFPFLAAAVFAGWVLPQLIGLMNDFAFPYMALERTIFFAVLCLAACYFGYVVNKKPMAAWNWQLNPRRLLVAAFVFSVIGAYFFYLVGQLADEARAEMGGAWSGKITIYVFFSHFVTYGLVLAIVSYHLRKSGWAFSIIALDVFLYLDRILLQGRRAAMVELFLIALLALWFHRKLVLPRMAMLAVLPAAAMVVAGIGAYRGVMVGDQMLDWTQLDLVFSRLSEFSFESFWEAFLAMLSGTAYELTNAVLIIAATDQTHDFDYGLSLWNTLVFQYVPAQLLGAEFKQSLMFEFADQAYNVFGHESHPGATYTGLADSFASFWYFGAIKFFIIAFIMSRLYKAAIQGHLVAQILMMLTVTYALHGITHSTNWYFSAWFKILVFVLPVLYWASDRQSARKSNLSMQDRAKS